MNTPIAPSKDVQKRLDFIAYYEKVRDVTKTCKQYGISRPTFYKWYKRYQKQGVEGLEDQPKTPKYHQQIKHDSPAKTEASTPAPTPDVSTTETVPHVVPPTPQVVESAPQTPPSATSEPSSTDPSESAEGDKRSINEINPTTSTHAAKTWVPDEGESAAVGAISESTETQESAPVGAISESTDSQESKDVGAIFKSPDQENQSVGAVFKPPGQIGAISQSPEKAEHTPPETHTSSPQKPQSIWDAVEEKEKAESTEAPPTPATEPAQVPKHTEASTPSFDFKKTANSVLASIHPSKKTVKYVGLAIGIILALTPPVYFYNKYREALMRNENPEEARRVEAEALVKKVGELIELPADEQPTVATVFDKEQLASQPFFADAKEGDKVLLYQSSGKAILYDPGAHKIIEVGIINAGRLPTEVTP